MIIFLIVKLNKHSLSFVIKNRIKKILVPLDGSANSIRGLDEAIRIARQSHATITGVLVLSAPPVLAYQARLFKGKAFANARRLMERAKLRAAKNGILFEYKILGGDPGDIIIRLANSKTSGYNLIVMGHRGISGAKELFLGSVSNYVLHKSKIPILIVK